MYKTDALIKEHGRVGVGIERHDLAMCGHGAAIRFCFFHKPAEKGELALVAFLQKTFGVPLYADDAFLFVTLNGFYDAVGRISRRAEAISGIGHCLVVHGVNRKAFAEQASDDGIRFGRHIVRWYAARHFLVVFEERRRFGHSCAQILVHCSAERYGQRLNASAYAQHRDLPIIGEANQKQFVAVSFRIDFAQARNRIFPKIERVYIGTAGEHQAIDAVEHRKQQQKVVRRRNNQRNTPRRFDAGVIAFGELAAIFSKIARNAYDWACGMVRKMVRDREIISFNIKIHSPQYIME